MTSRPADLHENGVWSIQVGPISAVVVVLSGTPFCAAIWRSSRILGGWHRAVPRAGCP